MSHVVGSFMYVMVCTRSDLAQIVSVVRKYIDNIGKEH